MADQLQRQSSESADVNSASPSAGVGRLTSHLWALLFGILATLTGVLLAPTTAASAATVSYDAPVVSRVEVHKFGHTDATAAQLRGSREGFASPAVEAHGASTTSSVVANATEAAGGGTTRVYRVEGPGNARLDISPAGEVGIKGDNTLFLNFGDEARAQSFLDRRLSQGFEGTQIKSFEVPTSYVDELRASAVPESMARQFPNSPLVVDVNQAADQFGLRACQFGGLQTAIVPGSGRMGC